MPADEEHHQITVFTAVGGQPFFDALVEGFYARVAADEVLLPLYPDQVDLGPARERLALFLGQYWGGPPAYEALRGHPRLRMRHVPFAIGADEADHWVHAMADSLEEVLPATPLDPELQSVVEAQMRSYFTQAAQHMINRP